MVDCLKGNGVPQWTVPATLMVVTKEVLSIIDLWVRVQEWPPRCQKARCQMEPPRASSRSKTKKIIRRRISSPMRESMLLDFSPMISLRPRKFQLKLRIISAHTSTLLPLPRWSKLKSSQTWISKRSSHIGRISSSSQKMTCLAPFQSISTRTTRPIWWEMLTT